MAGGGGERGWTQSLICRFCFSLGFLERNPCKKQWMTVSVTCDFYHIINWPASIHQAEFSWLTPHG